MRRGLTCPLHPVRRGRVRAEARTQPESLHPDPNEREKILRELHEMLGTGQGYERLARVAEALDAHETLDEDLFREACG